MPSLPVPVLLAALAAAQPAPGDGPIQDNSFLIEEAYNQEPGVIQHVSTFSRSRGGAWAYSFTEEWPVLGQTHQASVTFAAGAPEDGGAGIGDLALNYRLQLRRGDGDGIAAAPRLTVVLPTGEASRGRGGGGIGLQVNLPMSVATLGRFVAHANLGGTWVPSARIAGEDASSFGRAMGASVVWLAHRKLNLLVEALYTATELSLPGRTARDETFTINPGLRAAIDVAGGLQIVPGVAVPIGAFASRGERAVFLYLSLEHPFRWAGPTAPTG
jgi:hypothetical protein